MALKLIPHLMFAGDAEDAMNFYVSLFPGARIKHVERYGPEGPGKEGTVMVARFVVVGQELTCIDSPVEHAFTFTPSMSLYVEFDDESEMVKVVETLSKDGEVMMPLGDYGFSTRFAWVNDRFGVSWQLNLL